MLSIVSILLQSTIILFCYWSYLEYMHSVCIYLTLLITVYAVSLMIMHTHGCSWVSVFSIGIIHFTVVNIPLFHSFSPSLPPSLIPLCVAQFSSIQFSLIGFIDMKCDMCHPSTLQQKLINPSINQDVNLLSTAPSLLSLPFCLSHFPSFISPICYRLLGF